MHELLLFGVVPHSQKHHILSVLAGVAAMQPLPLLEQHLIFKPTVKPGAQNVAGRPNPGSRPVGASGDGLGAMKSHVSSDLFYLQLIGDFSSKRKLTQALSSTTRSTNPTITEKDAQGDVHMQADTSDTIAEARNRAFDEAGAEKIPWALEFRDLPDVPGKRPATSRMMSSIPISQGNAKAFLEAMGYT